MNNESFYMHPRYNEFTAFLDGLKTDARITPNALNLAFDVWLLGGNMGESKEEWYIAENERLTKQVEQLIKDVHRIDSARQAAVSQCAAMAEEVDRLNNHLFAASQENLRLKTWCTSFDDGAIGERGDACMSIDGGNL